MLFHCYFSLDGIFPGLRYFLDLDFRSTTLAKPEKVTSRAGKQADSDLGKHITATCGLTRAKLVYRESSRRAAPAKLYTRAVHKK